MLLGKKKGKKRGGGGKGKKGKEKGVKAAASYHPGTFLFDITIPYVPRALLTCMSRAAFIWITQSLFSTQTWFWSKNRDSWTTKHKAGPMQYVL